MGTLKTKPTCSPSSMSNQAPPGTTAQWVGMHPLWFRTPISQCMGQAQLLPKGTQPVLHHQWIDSRTTPSSNSLSGKLLYSSSSTLMPHSMAESQHIHQEPPHMLEASRGVTWTPHLLKHPGVVMHRIYQCQLNDTVVKSMIQHTLAQAGLRAMRRRPDRHQMHP